MAHGVGEPPAIPHTSESGARPGLRKGWNFQMSCGDISVALRLEVQYFFARVGLKGFLRVALQWSPAHACTCPVCIRECMYELGRREHLQFGMRCPCESHVSHPGVHPCENQNTD
eukprot:COSAG02_NODE_2512_length_8621_cov_278.639062_11_plen_115_part_00